MPELEAVCSTLKGLNRTDPRVYANRPGTLHMIVKFYAS